MKAATGHVVLALVLVAGCGEVSPEEDGNSTAAKFCECVPTLNEQMRIAQSENVEGIMGNDALAKEKIRSACSEFIEQAKRMFERHDSNKERQDQFAFAFGSKAKTCSLVGRDSRRMNWKDYRTLKSFVLELEPGFLN